LRLTLHNNSSREHEEACKALKKLGIISRKLISADLGAWTLNEMFKTNLKVTLVGGGQRWDVQPMTEKDDKRPKDETLENYPMERWEQILHFMVGLKDENYQGVSSETRQALVHSKLVVFEANEPLPCITSDGFQFLLMDTKSQIWLFVLKLLEMIDSRTNNLAECLTFLLQLNFSTYGRDYSTIGFSDTIVNFVQTLREIGLIYQRSRRDGRFYPTKSVIDLASGLRDVKTDIHRQGFIIVESNYRMYAYTDSRLQIALIALFCEIHYRFSNIVIGLITRDSVRQALKSGMSAQQIINYLLMHAHPSVRDSENPLPPTVIDQINLWEREREKFVFTKGRLYSQFNSQLDFDHLRKYADDHGFLIFDNPAARVMVVHDNGHEAVRKYWKKIKKKKEERGE
jgi:transcription initiation factor TFIIH subunit 4